MPAEQSFACRFWLGPCIGIDRLRCELQTRKRAEHFIRGLQTLKVGTSTTQDAMRIVARYGGWEMNLNADPHDVAPWGMGPCAGPHPRFGMRVAPDLVNRSVYSVPLLQYLGLHIWGVAGTVDGKDGKVLCILQNVGFGRSDGHDITVQAKWSQSFRHRTNSRRTRFGHTSYGITFMNSSPVSCRLLAIRKRAVPFEWNSLVQPASAAVFTLASLHPWLGMICLSDPRKRVGKSRARMILVVC